MVEIIPGLPDAFRVQAAEIYCEAFRRKIQPLVASRERQVALFSRLFDARQAVIAVAGGVCLGLAGLGFTGRHFVDAHLPAFVQELGWLRGAPGCWMFHAFEPPPPSGELHIECLAVSARARGKGIGTRLLAAVELWAREGGYRQVGLEVVDTNPLARRLYEREGFVARREYRFPLLRYLVGFSAATSMVKRVAGS